MLVRLQVLKDLWTSQITERNEEVEQNEPISITNWMKCNFHFHTNQQQNDKQITTNNKLKHVGMSIVFSAGTTRSPMPMLAIYVHSRGWILMGRHMSDTCTMYWEICYVHPQTGDSLFVDTVHYAGCRRLQRRKSVDKQTYVDRQIDGDRITQLMAV